MPLEIERKYLVDREKWQALSKREGQLYRQGYLVTDPAKSIRIRIAKTKGFLTIKGESSGATRAEYEYEIPVKDAEELLADFSVAELKKIRYKIMYKNKLWEVDDFYGENEGLLLAEIELKKENESFEIPEWITEEVTEDDRYYNVNLAQNPYGFWKPKVYSSKVPVAVLKNIAESLEAGMNCFIDRTTFEVVTIPDTSRFPEMDLEDGESLWKEDIDKVSGNPEYVEIEKMSSSDSFRVMEDFADSLPESTTKVRLITALEGHKPFGNFNHQIHQTGIEKQQWFTFRTERNMEWVSEQLKGRI